MENKIIEKILEDIYLIDSDLRKNEKQLIKIINELLASKPETRFDDKFSLALRSEVLKKIEELEIESKLKKEKFINLFNFNFMKKTYYIGAGVFACLLLIVFAFNFYPKNSVTFSLNDEILDLSPKIARIENNAFGILTSQSPEPALGSKILSGDANIESAPLGLGGGGSTITSSRMMPTIIAPDYTKYNYIYKGEDFEIPSEGDVYKKNIKSEVSKSLAQKLNLNFGLLDLNKFENTSLTNFSISEDREYGYNVYFNLLENLVSINMEWSKWPQINNECRDEACYERSRLKINDVPNDSEIINIAKQAISEYEIDMTNFGEARINNSWRREYDRVEDKNIAYIPDTITVVFPLKINDKEVHDDYNNGAGINVDVNIRYKKMSSIRGISINDYQVSSYPLEQDQKRILKFAEQGGLYSGYMTLDSTKEEDIELGTPSFGLITNWKYDNASGRGEEYYIPALIFPIISENKSLFYSRNSISIPLLSDLLDQAEAEASERPEPILMQRADSVVSNELEVQNMEGVEAPMMAPETMTR